MMNPRLALAFAVVFAAVTACAPASEEGTDGDSVVNPLTCEATNRSTTLKCVGTGIEGDLYTCDCTRPTLDTCAVDTDCDSEERCVDGECNELATFTDLEICVDGLSADEVLDRCSGLPPAP